MAKQNQILITLNFLIKQADTSNKYKKIYKPHPSIKTLQEVHTVTSKDNDLTKGKTKIMNIKIIQTIMPYALTHNVYSNHYKLLTS
jgi:hypothetical protein